MSGQRYETAFVRELYESCWRNQKQFSSLLEYLEPFVAARHIPALIELATVYMLMDKQEDSVKLIQDIEDRLDGNDTDAHVDLFIALRSGLGAGSQEERNERALRYMKKLANFGNVPVQEMLMMDYLHGTNGVPNSIQCFLHWAKVAAENGSILAKEELAQFRGTSGSTSSSK